MFNEEQNAQNSSYGRELLKKWHKIIEADGGVASQYMAEQTAILLENYLSHLNENPTLIAEDEIQTGNFKGVNLALLGLIRRTIPTLIAADMVGMQSMPTPNSPIFYLVFKKAFDSAAGSAGLSPKGASIAGQELWGYPNGGVGDLTENFIDPYFTSNLNSKTLENKEAATSFGWVPLISGTVRLVAYKDGQAPLVAHAEGDYTTGQKVSGNITIGGKTLNITVDSASTFTIGGDMTEAEFDTNRTTGGYTFVVEWEHFMESNSRMPELTLNIEQENVRLIKRNLRGKYTFDAMQDAKVLHGISLDTELMEMMRLELTNEINREIVKDLRTMAAIRKEVTYGTGTFAGYNVTGNYEDMHRFLLDKIAAVASEIYTQGRLGKGNFVVGNPSTLAFLERVNGFLGSGIDYDGNTLTFKGKLGKLKFYEDPQYPKNELLIGYKGTSALDTGYIFAPYQPIVAMPTLYDPLTSDMRKIFQTRYGKSYQFVPEGQYKGTFRNAIYRGAYQYATLKLNGFPQLL